jgi:hypothetical protein
LQTSIPQFTVESGGIPTAESLPIQNGRLDPYVVVRFTDMMPTSGDGSFMGPTHDGYYTYIDCLCVGETDRDARELANLANSYMLGKKFDNASAIAKAFGGGSYAILSSASKMPEAYIQITSFRAAVNLIIP